MKMFLAENVKRVERIFLYMMEVDVGKQYLYVRSMAIQAFPEVFKELEIWTLLSHLCLDEHLEIRLQIYRMLMSLFDEEFFTEHSDEEFRISILLLMQSLDPNLRL